MADPVVDLRWMDTQLLVGPGSFDQVAKRTGASSQGAGRVVIFCGRESMRRQGILDRLISQFSDAEVEVFDGAQANPTFESCQTASDFLLHTRPKVLVALGGGSVIDTAKVATIAAGSGSSVRHLLQDGGRVCGRAVDTFVAVPTTAGTGSEVTSFATVWDFETPRKYSLDTPLACPTLSVLDAGLTVGMPGALTVTTALDALGHALESFWSRSASPVSRGISLEAIRIMISNLPKLDTSPKDLRNRGSVLWASLLGGMAISQTRTAAAHAISYGLTLRFGVPHGLAVGLLLPAVFNANRSSGLSEEKVESLEACFSRGGGIRNWVDGVLKRFDVPTSLSKFGVRESDIETIVADSNVPGRMDNNSGSLSHRDLTGIISGVL